VIKSFRDKDAEAQFRREPPARLRSIANVARRRLIAIDISKDVTDLRQPPGNWLEMLSGNRKGQFSIRNNDQYRICFRWHLGNAYDVEIVDYH
jgi:proteic killer suppression protein